ncbi:MAG: SynChlorMet cassette radical SAM/SPASM protein ScmE [Campylobacterota bacterium]|nr:SynChlorMet cassette radical SAM/SPASM protein ScmE [Campylobacterota bacterium]
MTQVKSRLISTPREIDVELTGNCNLRCHYCYFFDNPDVEYKDLDTAEWLRFFDECGEANVMSLRLAGGEPFYRKDLRELIEGIVKNRMRFSMLSNGGLVTEEIAHFIASTGRCDSIQISLDGGRAEVHDKVRGKGSFDQAIEGIKLLQKYNIPVTMRCTIHHYNVDDLEETAKFVLEDLNLPDFSTNAAGYLGTCQNNAENLMLTVEDRMKAMMSLDKLDKQYPGSLTASAGPLADLQFWREMERSRSEQLSGDPSTGALTGCGCHTTKLSVRSDGHYAVCSMISGISLGKINSDKLVDVWINNSTLCGFRERHNIKLTSFDYCRDCGYADHCTGNCPAIAYSMTGNAHQPAPDACYKLFLEQGGILPPEYKEQENSQ